MQLKKRVKKYFEKERSKKEQNQISSRKLEI